MLVGPGAHRLPPADWRAGRYSAVPVDEPSRRLRAAFATERGARDALEFLGHALERALSGHIETMTNAWNEPDLSILVFDVAEADCDRVVRLIGFLHGVVVEG